MTRVGVQGAHHQGDEHLGAARPRRPDRHGRGVAPACRSSTTCSTSSAATAASTSTCRPRATSTSTATTPSRTSASRWARCSARRSATRPASAASPAGCSRSTRRSSRSPSTSRAGPFTVYDVPFGEVLPLGDPPFNPEMAEHFWQRFATAAGITLHVKLREGRNTHHIVEATFKGVARCLRDAVRVEGAGIPSTKGVV